MVKRTGGLKGCKHYESKSIAHYRNGGEVGGVGGGSGVDGSGNRGNGGYGGGTSGNQGGGGLGGGGKDGVRGTGVSTGRVTGSTARAQPERMAYVNGEPIRVVGQRQQAAKPVTARKPAAVPYGMSPPAKPIGRITSITGGYGIQGYGPTPGAVPAQFKQYYDRIAGNLPTAVTGGHGTFGYGGGRFSKGGSVPGKKGGK